MNFLTTTQVALKLDISPRTVQRMIESGRLQAARIGHEYMIEPRALDNLLTVTNAGRGAKKMKEEYWIAFRRLLAKRGRLSNLPKPQPESWMAFTVGRDCRVAAHVRINERKIGVDLTLGRKAKDLYERLEHDREVIQEEVGLKLEWHQRPNNAESWVLIREDADPA